MTVTGKGRVVAGRRLGDVVVTNHHRWHAEIHHFVQLANQAQSTFEFRRLRLKDEHQASLYRSPIDVSEAFREIASLRSEYELPGHAAVIVVVESNLQDDEDDEYFLYESLPDRAAIVSSYHLDPRSAFMDEGAAWWKAASEGERRRIASGSILVTLLSATAMVLAHSGTHRDTRGCVMDYCQNPIDIAATLRGGITFCDECREALDATDAGKAMLRIADSLRGNPMRRIQLASDEFDVLLLSRPDADLAEVREIASKLRERGVRPWLEVEQRRPGVPAASLLEEQIERVRSAAVFVGSEGIGPWADPQIDAVLQRIARRGCPVIPVLLPTARDQPRLPSGLEGRTWVDYRISDPDPAEQLIWGITGEATFQPSGADAHETGGDGVAAHSSPAPSPLPPAGDGALGGSHAPAAPEREPIGARRSISKRISLAAAAAVLLAAVGTAGVPYVHRWLDSGHVTPPENAVPRKGVTILLNEDQGGLPEEVVLYQDSYALVIGNDNYSRGWPTLTKAADDTRNVAGALRANGFLVEEHLDLAGEALERTLKTFFINKGTGKETRLLVWFSGHGHSDHGEGYLVPVDAPLPEDRVGFKKVALPIRRFGEWMRLADAKHVLAVFDSCFAGTVFAIARDAPPAAVTRATTYPVRQFITSGDADETVLDDGTFAELFIRALRGEEGDSNTDGYVTGSELGLYLSNRVTNLTPSQSPRYGKLTDKDFDRGDFVFVVGAPPSPQPQARAPTTSSR